MNIAVFCPNLVGDTVMATPVFRALRNAHPSARITALIKPGIRATIEGGPWFDAILPFDPRSKSPEHQTWPVVKALRSNRPDLAVLLPNSFRSTIVAFLGGARRRIGYARGGRGILLTDRLAPKRDHLGRYVPTPIVDDYLAIAVRLGCPIDSRRLELGTTEVDESNADRALQSIGMSPTSPYIAFNTGGAFGPAKSWPNESFAELARRLHDEHGRQIVVLCGPSEREAAREIAEKADRPGVRHLADQALSIGLSKALVKRASLLITTDSGPRHFAAAFDVPVLSLFGPTHIAWTLTHFNKALHLHHPVDCGPCQKPICPAGHHRCLRDMSPDSVLRAALRLLNGPPLVKETIEFV